MATSVCHLLIKVLVAERKAVNLFSVTLTCHFCSALHAKPHNPETGRRSNLQCLWELHKEKWLSSGLCYVRKKAPILKGNRRHFEEWCPHLVWASVCFARLQQPFIALIKRETSKTLRRQRTLTVTQNHCLWQAGTSCLIKMSMSLTGSGIPNNGIQSPIWAFPPLERTTQLGTSSYGFSAISPKFCGLW